MDINTNINANINELVKYTVFIRTQIEIKKEKQGKKSKEIKDTEYMYGFGTGFLYLDNSNNNNIYYIITARHVIFQDEKLVDALKFYINLATNTETNTETKYVQQKILMRSFQIKHNMKCIDEMDLCYINVTEWFRHYPLDSYHRFINESMILSKDEMKKLNILDEVIVTGYPNAMRDTQYTLPIVTPGTLATKPEWEYNLSRNFSSENDFFIININCYNGSSGSPVYFRNLSKIYLIGVLIQMFNYNKTFPLDIGSNISVPDSHSDPIPIIPAPLGRVVPAYNIIKLFQNIT